MSAAPPATEFVVRDALSADAATIVDYNARMAQETEGKALDAETLRRGVAAVLADAAHGRYFLACRDGAVVGQLMLTYEWSDWRNGRIWWIQSVYVLPAARRQGAFAALYRHVRRLARETPGVVGLRLYVEHQNASAQEVYGRLGMRAAGYQVLEEMFGGGGD